ncbi:MAG: hypothetical protein ACI9R3_001808 [Verrucomicrobiales bacterium]|jgi:hypothetical protein
MKFTEAQLEAAILELLGVEGYTHVLGEAIERQPQEVLIKADLRSFLAKQYAADNTTSQEIEAVIKPLSAYSAADLYESTRAIMKLVSDGFLLKREVHSQKVLPNLDRNQNKLSGATIWKFRIVHTEGSSRHSVVRKFQTTANDGKFNNTPSAA